MLNMERPNVDPNQLWVHISGFAEGSIFAIYPKILEEIFLQEEQCREEEARQENGGTTLPSDMEWRLKAYFQLVEKQREMDDMPAESPALEKLRAARRWSRPDSATDPWSALSGLAMGATRRPVRSLMPKKNKRLRDPPWGPRDLAKASRLLERPPMSVQFEDDQEMRRVYSLIYDVFRYKCVLEEALLDTGFYAAFPEAVERKSLAWLLLFDQQRRRWAKRDLTNDEMETTHRDVRSRSRSRRKSSLKISRDSSSESRPSLDGRHSRSSIRWKIRDEMRSPDDFASLTAKDIEDMDDTIREEVDPESEMFQERKSSDGSGSSAKTLQKQPTEDLEYSVSRCEMRDVMERAAGEIGSMVKNFDIVLWDHRVRIAAAIAKIRIRNKALTLSELLPPHLRDERVMAASKRDVITGWVNVFKSKSITELVQRLNEMGYSYSTSRSLEPNQFKFDRICPKFISLNPAMRNEFARSSLLLDNIIILQEREFCLGAAALCSAMKNAQLNGDVIQTHGTSPKAAAYLAAQLKDWPAYQGQLIVFGAGDRKPEYEDLLKTLGATNARIVAEGALEAGGSLWTGAVAALAAPPNSYSAVADPIDLVCSRGGDLRMLEVLTESEINDDGKNRVMKILEEQKKTLRLCMSKPQIQMIVYETHSSLSAENGDMVRRAVAEANRAAREMHSVRRQRARDAAPRTPKCATVGQPMETTESELDETAPGSPLKYDPENPDAPQEPKLELNIEEVDQNPLSPKVEDKSNLHIPIVSAQLSPHTPTDPDSELSDIKVPDCDLFEEEYPYTFVGMSAQDRDACFLALIKRKELIRMNAKYMINFAESRGLFGGNSPPPKKPPPSKKKNDGQKSRHNKRKLSKLEMERIAAPTHAWSARVSSCSVCDFNSEYMICNACARRNAISILPRARIWWRLAIRHVISSGNLPLYLPRLTRPSRPQLAMPVAKPVFDSTPEMPQYGCTVYAKMLEAIDDM